jgi:hypothetical protein
MLEYIGKSGLLIAFPGGMSIADVIQQARSMRMRGIETAAVS